MVARMEATALVRPPSSGRMGLVGTGVVFAALAAGLVVFLMMPRTGRIAVNIADTQGGAVNHVEIFVDGKKQCDTSPCIVDQVSTGVHQVKVLAQGYDPPADRAVTVESRKDATIDFTMTSGGPGARVGTGIKVGGSQSGVKLFVDGKEIGPLPQELHDLAPGDHTIHLAGSDRYAPLDKKIILAKDEVQDLGDQTLKVVKGKATITLGTTGAKVSIVSGSDRREFPTLPIAVDLDTTKPWALEASKPGFADYHQPVSFDDGVAEKTFNISLDPKAAAPVAMGGGGGGGGYAAPPPQPQSSTPKWAAPPTPKPAPVSAASGDDSDSTPAAAGGGDGYLNFNSIPASSIILDGKPVGNTPKVHFAVSPGRHTVLYVNSDEGLKKQITVTVGAGETKPAIAKLRE
jgi:serine/threonine-protein kinase